MAWSTFFFLFTISSFKAWRPKQIGVTLQIRYLASPPPPAMGLTGTSGPQRLKSESTPTPTRWICITEELAHELDITSLYKRARMAPGERKQTASSVASLAWKTNRAFQALILGNSIQLSTDTGWPSLLRHCSQSK